MHINYINKIVSYYNILIPRYEIYKKNNPKGTINKKHLFS